MLLGLSPIRRQRSDNTHLPQRESTAMNITRTKTARHAAAAVAALLIAAGCGSDTADTPEVTEPATAETPAPTLRDVAKTAATTAPPTPVDTPSADADPAQTSPQDTEQGAAQEPSGTEPSTEAVLDPMPAPEYEPQENAIGYTYDPPPPSVAPDAIYEWQPPQAQRVPAVHPDTAMASWITGQPHDPPEGLPEVPLVGFRHRDNPGGELPRATPGVFEWAQWCTQGPAVSYDTINAGSCGLMLNKMVWALDYMGAEESCVLDQYRQKMQWLAETGGGGRHREALRLAPMRYRDRSRSAQHSPLRPTLRTGTARRCGAGDQTRHLCRRHRDANRHRTPDRRHLPAMGRKHRRPPGHPSVRVRSLRLAGRAMDAALPRRADPHRVLRRLLTRPSDKRCRPSALCESF